MLAVMQNHQYHQPRHTPLSSSTGSSRTAYSNGNSSFRTTSSGLTSVGSGSGYSAEYTMSSSPQQFPTGKLHKRSQSSQTAHSSITTSSTEDVFAIDTTHHKKGRIKPLLKRVSHAGSSTGKLDLGKIDGGAGGAYYTAGRGSASDLNSFVPTHRQHHKRTISSNSSQIVVSPNMYPPRRYTPTPTASYPNSIGDHSDSSDQEDFVPSLPKRSGSGLRNHTGNYPSPLSLPPRMSATQDSIASISPITPLGRGSTHTFENLPQSSKKQKRILGSQDAGDDFEETIRAAREAWERKEKEKEEREEKKEEKKARKTSTPREKDIDEPSSSKQRNRWTLGRHSAPTLETEKTIGVPYSSDDERAASASRIGSVVMRGAQESRNGERDKKSSGVRTQWLGFVVWIKIGMVRIGRKIKLF